jgi:hypothetical protein
MDRWVGTAEELIYSANMVKMREQWCEMEERRTEDGRKLFQEKKVKTTHMNIYNYISYDFNPILTYQRQGFGCYTGGRTRDNDKR